MGRPLTNSITHAALLQILSWAPRRFCATDRVFTRMCRRQNHFADSSPQLLITAFLTHSQFSPLKRRPRSLHTLPVQSHLNQVHINHCHGAAYSWPSVSTAGQRWQRGNKQRRGWKGVRASWGGNISISERGKTLNVTFHPSRVQSYTWFSTWSGKIHTFVCFWTRPLLKDLILQES